MTSLPARRRATASVWTTAVGGALLVSGCETGPLELPCRLPTSADPAASLDRPAPGLLAEEADPVPLVLNLPLEPGVEAEVTQGFDGGFTHVDAQRFAWDLAVPVGTVVTAAADGLVTLTAAGSDAFGEDPSFRDLANRVVIDHGAGLFSAYVHLSSDGVLVVPGERVRAGDAIGLTGLSGQLTGPHLHFHVENLWSETLPARFIDPTTGLCAWLPRGGDIVEGHPPFSAPDAAPGPLPPATFSAFGVPYLTGLPARLFRHGAPYAFSGRARAGATEVAFLLLPEGGGTAVLAQRPPVSPDGTFADTVTLDVPPGTYGWAMTEAGAAPARVPASVRCTLLANP